MIDIATRRILYLIEMLIQGLQAGALRSLMVKSLQVGRYGFMVRQVFEAVRNIRSVF